MQLVSEKLLDKVVIEKRKYVDAYLELYNHIKQVLEEQLIALNDCTDFNDEEQFARLAYYFLNYAAIRSMTFPLIEFNREKGDIREKKLFLLEDMPSTVNVEPYMSLTNMKPLSVQLSEQYFNKGRYSYTSATLPNALVHYNEALNIIQNHEAYKQLSIAYENANLNLRSAIDTLVKDVVFKMLPFIFGGIYSIILGLLLHPAASICMAILFSRLAGDISFNLTVPVAYSQNELNTRFSKTSPFNNLQYPLLNQFDMAFSGPIGEFHEIDSDAPLNSARLLELIKKATETSLDPRSYKAGNMKLIEGRLAHGQFRPLNDETCRTTFSPRNGDGESRTTINLRNDDEEMSKHVVEL